MPKKRVGTQAVLVRLDGATNKEIRWLAEISGLSMTRVVHRLINREAKRVREKLEQGEGILL